MAKSKNALLTGRIQKRETNPSVLISGLQHTAGPYKAPCFTRGTPRNLVGGNAWGDLGNKAGPALEGYVAPQPSHGNYETIPDAY